jgi:hypothetical protein
MSQVEIVALWAGLIASVAGIVLSFVATIFAVLVSKQSTEVNQQMIKSLQKTESTVEHLSDDTGELIKAGWNKMLTGFGREHDADATALEATNEISEGVASEVRSQLEDNLGESDSQRIERLEATLDDLKETTAALLRRKYRRDSEDVLMSLTEELRLLPVEARAVLTILSRGGHITRKQYISSIRHPLLKGPIKRLRAFGLLIPLVGNDEGGRSEPVYYFPPHTTNQIKLASQLVGDIPNEVLDSISGALKNIGYSTARFDERAKA